MHWNPVTAWIVLIYIVAAAAQFFNEQAGGEWLNSLLAQL